MKAEPIMKISLDEGAKEPTRSHEADAGLDLYAPAAVYIGGRDIVQIDTGVHIELPKNTYGKIANRSSMYLKGIETDGTIDEGYNGAIKVTLHNHSDHAYWIEACDRIAQLIVLPIIKPKIQIVDELEETDRSDGGFGSTGK